MSQKVGSDFANSKQVKNLVIIFLTLNRPKSSAVILLTLNDFGNGYFWDIPVKPCQNLFLGSFYSYAMVALVFLKIFSILKFFVFLKIF